MNVFYFRKMVDHLDQEHLDTVMFQEMVEMFNEPNASGYKIIDAKRDALYTLQSFLIGVRLTL